MRPFELYCSFENWTSADLEITSEDWSLPTNGCQGNQLRVFSWNSQFSIHIFASNACR